MTGFTHIPVLLDKVLEILRPEQGGPYWDLTLGAGGHLRAYLERAPEGTEAYGLDGDPAAIERTKHLPATLVHGDLAEVQELGWPAPRAVLLDVGLSSPQVDDAERGFSYRLDGPLDMRMDPTRGWTAAEWLIRTSRQDLEKTIRELGEERFAGRIARVIKEQLPINTTSELAEAVLDAVGRHRDRRHHPARRTFQAIRIAVNQELERLEAALEASISALAPGGRIVVLSYHSGEDRVVKNVFRSRERAGDVSRLMKKPLVCDPSEAHENPRARSVKLRACEKR